MITEQYFLEIPIFDIFTLVAVYMHLKWYIIWYINRVMDQNIQKLLIFAVFDS